MHVLFRFVQRLRHWFHGNESPGDHNPERSADGLQATPLTGSPPRLTLIKARSIAPSTTDRRSMNEVVRRGKIREIQDIGLTLEMGPGELISEIAERLNLGNSVTSCEMLSDQQLDLALHLYRTRMPDIGFNSSMRSMA